MKSRVIYYYQTFIGLKDILEQNPLSVTYIVSSIHFGYKNNKPYIHLNDNDPNDEKFNNLWSELKIANNLGIKIMFMLGGAGGVYNELFSNYNQFYSMLKNEIIKRPYISGIDLDVEEPTNILYLQLLISQLDNDFGKDFIISNEPLILMLKEYWYKKIIKKELNIL